MKTKTVQIYGEEERKNNDEHTRLQPRLIVHLTKTKEFDDIYDDFETKFNKMVEEHKEDIDNSRVEVDEEQN